MKRMLKYAVVALCLMCLLLPWVSHAEAEGTVDVPPAIKVSGLKKTDEGYSLQVVLDGYKEQGDKVLLALYDRSGRLKRLTAVKPEASLTVEAAGADPSDTAKVMWVNGDFSPVCSAAKVAFSYTIERFSSWMDFAGATSDIVSDYEYIGESNGFGAQNADEFASARLIVKAKGDLPDISAYCPLRAISDGADYFILQFAEPDQARECADYLSGADGIVYVEPDGVIYTAEDVAGDDADAATVTGYSWGVAATYAGDYAQNLKNRGKTGTIVVAVVDSGADFNHSFLKPRLTSNGYDFVDRDSNPMYSVNDHGTHVAGTIVDCTPGLNVRVMPVRVLNSSGKGSFGNVADGIRYAANHGASVINLSLSGGHSSYIDDAVKYAVNKGVTVAVAAGNDNTNTSSKCPAHISSAITVSAVDSSKNRASFSNYGSAVDIAAPGVSVRSSIPGNSFGYKNGTSMSTPHVAAAAAMILLDYPGLSCSQVESKLKSAAIDLGTRGNDIYYGAGFLNLKPFITSGPTGYTVSYNANGGSGAPASQTKIAGVTLKLSTVKPTRTNTVFFNYNDGSGKGVSKTYTATFKNWNTSSAGTGTSYSPGASYTKNASMTLYAQWTLKKLGTLPKLTWKGYRFLGWYTAASGGTKITDATMVSGNVTYYAHWERDQHVVTYDANGGTGAPESQVKLQDITLKLSTGIPSRKYTVTFDFNAGNGKATVREVNAPFKNWNTKKAGGGTSYAPGAVYTKNASMTLYAQWQPAKIGTLPTITRTGYEFLGWYTQAKGGKKITEATTVSGNATVYAHWAHLYTVSYYGNGGYGVPASQVKVEGVSLKLSSVKPKANLAVTFKHNDADGTETVITVPATFKNWNTKAAGGGTSYSAGATYAKNADLTLYAQWSSGKVGTLPTPVRSGYVFLGWYTASSGGTKVTPNTTVSRATTFYARWAKSYTVSYKGNGGTDVPATQYKQENVSLKLSSTKPVRKNTVVFDYNNGTGKKSTATYTFTFVNWNTAKDGTGVKYTPGSTYKTNAALVLYAQWKPIMIGTLPTPTSSGFELLGWYTEPVGGSRITENTQVTGNKTYYAQWGKTYRVTFNANGGTGAPGVQLKPDNADLKLSTVKPTREHTVTFVYNDGTNKKTTLTVAAEFKNWNTQPDGKGTVYASGGLYKENADVTLYARWWLGTVGTLPTLKRTGFNFMGWYTAASGGTKISDEKAVSADVTYYAHWAKTYKVSYNANGGKGVPESQIKVQGVDLRLSSYKPVREFTVTYNHNDGTGKKTTAVVAATLANWNTKKDGKGTAYASGGVYKENKEVTLYAQWTMGTLGKMPTPTRNGYALEGWYTAAQGGTKVTSSTVVKSNVTYYAHWKKAYTVTYDANGGTDAPASQIKQQDVDLQLSYARPVREHTVTFVNNDGTGKETSVVVAATFNNWNTMPDGSGDTYGRGATYTLNDSVTLYAQWTPGKVGTLPDPAPQAGYGLVGWYTAKTGGSKISESTKVDKDRTFYAHWAKSYKVNYHPNGGSNAPKYQLKLEDITLKLSTQKPTRENTITFDYNDGTGRTVKRVVAATFNNWNTMQDGSGTAYAPGASYTLNENVWLYAQWTMGTVGSLPAPTRQGYKLVGWYTAERGGSKVGTNTPVTRDTTYYARWQEN